MDSEFDDIRPFRDHEIESVIARMIESSDFISGIQLMTGTKITGADGKVNITAVDFIKKKLRSLTTVKEFQDAVVIEMMLKPVVKNSIDELTSSGIERLSKGSAYLYISNHRDITLDPALLTYCLHEKSFDTLEIAFGDNLLINQFISDLIRINKSFIVKRELPIMEQLRESVHLSKYIYYTLSRGISVWIAQREGRAKDGNDATNPAVIKMLTLSQKDGGIPAGEFIQKLNIVPVSVSYEYDPCDKMKGLELFRKQSDSSHEKKTGDDLASINMGITGYKGRVHYSFSEPLTERFSNEKEAANALDRAIISGYRLWPTNYIALDELNGTAKYSGFYSVEEKEKFLERYKRLQPGIRSIILEAYANPVINREKLG